MHGLQEARSMHVLLCEICVFATFTARRPVSRSSLLSILHFEDHRTTLQAVLEEEVEEMQEEMVDGSKPLLLPTVFDFYTEVIPPAARVCLCNIKAFSQSNTTGEHHAAD